jgi:hypothetical protein
MRKTAALAMILLPVILSGCSRTTLVTVPERMNLTGYETFGIVEFTSNSNASINAYATRHFQERVQAAQPGTRFVELGRRDLLLAALGAGQFDADAMKKIGAKYGVAAVFIGEIVYSESKTDIKVTDVAKLEGRVRQDVRGDISSKLFETRTGASVWSSSAWATRQVSRIALSDQVVSASTKNTNPREDMIPALMFHLTQDFRPSQERQRAK